MARDPGSTAGHKSAPSAARARVDHSLSRAHVVLLPALLLAFGLGLSYRVAELQAVADVDRSRERVTIALDQIRGTLSRELYGAIHLTAGLTSFVAVEGGIDEARFAAIAEELIRSSPLIRNIALAPDNVIRYVHPRAGNESVIGLDYDRHPGQRAAVLQAMSEHRTVVAGPVRLVQGGVGIIGRNPIFVFDSSHSPPTRRYWGVASTVVDFGMLMRAAGLDATQAQLKVSLRGEDGKGRDGDVFWGAAQVFAGEPVVLDVPLPAGSWQIAAVPLEGWPRVSIVRSWFFLIGGLISVVVTLLLHQVLHISASRETEIAERRRTELQLRQRNRALHLFSSCNGMVLQARDEDVLLSDICKMAVNYAGYRLAWVGRAEHDDARTVRPVTFAGPGQGFLDRIHVSWGDNEHGQGTAGIAIRTRLPTVARDLPHNPAFRVWRDALGTRDFATAIAVPLVVDGEAYGALVVYAAEPDAFDATEIELLDELGHNIAYGMSSLRAQKERALAMKELERHRLELEERVRERTQQLSVAKDAAEAADRIKSAFLATMSHELRTPLNSIIGFTGIMLQELAGPLSDEQRKQLGMVQGSAHHLLALINDVLDISKIEAGQLQVRREDFDLRDSVLRVVRTLRPLAEKKCLGMHVEIDHQVGLWTGDQRRIEQILMNLVGNAIKFTEQGKVQVRVTQTEGCIQVAVSDTGSGIRATDLPKLFAPFSQIETGLARRYDGTGLGLSICKRLLELMSGTISVESQPGVGSTFTFTLPKSRGESCPSLPS